MMQAENPTISNMSDEELVHYALTESALTPLELELALRLERILWSDEYGTDTGREG